MTEKKTNTGVTLIIPTLNEYHALLKIMPKIKEEWYDEMIIVDGGSTDSTIEYCHEHEYNIIHQEGIGIPLAMKTGFRTSTKDIIVTFSPDGNSLPELIPDLINKVNEGNDMVIVSRYMENSKSYDDSALSGFGNYLFTKIVNILFRTKITDSLVIFRAYTRKAVLEMELDRFEEEHSIRDKNWKMNSWELGSSIRAGILKLKVAEIPGDEPERIGGTDGKVNHLSHGIGAIAQILFDLIIWGPKMKREKLYKQIKESYE